MIERDIIRFGVADEREWSILQGQAFKPVSVPYKCHGCQLKVQGRILAAMNFQDQENKKVGQVCWCICYECSQPTILIRDGRQFVTAQHPCPLEFSSDKRWPADLIHLFDEASTAFSAGAFTACAMVCRKMLMVCAWDRGETDPKKNFAQNVDYICDSVLSYPAAKKSITSIRNIGNEANHKVDFVTKENARRSMEIISYMLNMIYCVPIP
jgi:Domain of unknown function (DUF4145)